MKYIILSDGTDEYPVIFNERLVHKCVSDGIRQEHMFVKTLFNMRPLNPIRQVL